MVAHPELAVDDVDSHWKSIVYAAAAAVELVAIVDAAVLAVAVAVEIAAHYRWPGFVESAGPSWHKVSLSQNEHYRILFLWRQKDQSIGASIPGRLLPDYHLQFYQG